MPKINQKGIAHVLVVLFLIIGLIVGLYLVKQKQIFKPRASVSNPTTSYALVTRGETVYPGGFFRAQIQVRADVDPANLLAAKLQFNPDLFQVDSVLVEMELPGGGTASDSAEPRSYEELTGTTRPASPSATVVPTFRPAVPPPSDDPDYFTVSPAQPLYPCSSSTPTTGGGSAVTEAEWEIINQCLASFTTEQRILYEYYMERQDLYFPTLPCDRRQQTSVVWAGNLRPGLANPLAVRVDEKVIDNENGLISLVVGVPSPGMKTSAEGTAAILATLLFRVKDGTTPTETSIQFTNDSAVYRNSDNINILAEKSGARIAIASRDSIPVSTRQPGTTESGRVCAQVITYATNPENGQCQQFPTPCDVPNGWARVDSCEIEESAENSQAETECAFWMELLNICSDEDNEEPLPSLSPLPSARGNQIRVTAGAEGDCNQNGQLGLDDLSTVYTEFNRTGNELQCDVNNDLKVNTVDYATTVETLRDHEIIQRQ